jgi:glycosyltransferase involved in cell wall biosynthesis
MPCFYSMAAASGGCLLITSKDESFGMAAVEAMACRLPVVASRVGALPEVLDGPHQAGLYSLHHVEAAAARVASLLDDPSEREALAEQGRRKVCERYSLQVAGETYLRVLASLKRGGSGP